MKEPTSEQARAQSHLASDIVEAVKVKGVDLTEEHKKIRLALLKQAVEWMPEMEYKVVRRLWQAACSMEFLGPEELNFRHHVSCAIATHYDLRRFRNKPLTAPQPAKKP